MQRETMKDEVAAGKASVLARASFFQREIENAALPSPSSSPPSRKKSSPARAPAASLGASRDEESACGLARAAPSPTSQPGTPSTPPTPPTHTLDSAVSQRRAFFLSEAEKLKQEEETTKAVRRGFARRKAAREAERAVHERAAREAGERRRLVEEAREREAEERRARRRAFERHVSVFARVQQGSFAATTEKDLSDNATSGTPPQPGRS